MGWDVQQQINALRDRIRALMIENQKLEADEVMDPHLADQKIRQNLDLISSLASQISALERQRK